MRVLLLVSFMVVPALAQGWPPGPPQNVPDCPYEYIDFNQTTMTYRYRTKTCSAAGGSVSIGESTYFFELLTPACDAATESCRNPTVGSGNPAAKKIEPIAEPDPIRDLPPAPRKPFADWQNFAETFLSRQVPCRSGFSNIQQVRKFAASKLTLAGARGKQLEKIKKATPDFVDQYLKAKSFGDQEQMVRDYSARIAALLEVSVPMRRNIGNVYKSLDLPVKSLPTRKAPNDAKSKTTTSEVGVVKVVAGKKTHFFKLTESSMQWFNQGEVKLRSGVEVASADGNVADATFDGRNNFVHRVKYKGNLYLVRTSALREE